jgi:hypothetical protein
MTNQPCHIETIDTKRKEAIYFLAISQGQKKKKKKKKKVGKTGRKKLFYLHKQTLFL